MAFEDPSTLKVDLVVDAEDSDSAQHSDLAKLDKTIDTAQETSAPVEKTDEASLTPWKNRFKNVNRHQPDSWQGRLNAKTQRFLEVGTTYLTVATIAVSAIALISSAQGMSPDHPWTYLLFLLPMVFGCLLYPLFVARLFRLLDSLRVKLPTRRVLAPVLMTNTVFTWHIFMFIDAGCISLVYNWIRSAGTSINHQQTMQAMAALAGGGALLVLLTLLLLLILSMVVFKRFFEWIDEATRTVHGVSLGVKRSGFYGFITGAIFGLCGTYAEFALGSQNSAEVFAITSLIWSVGILCCCLFLAAQERLRTKKSSK